jgi:hypothetical protein
MRQWVFGHILFLSQGGCGTLEISGQLLFQGV